MEEDNSLPEDDGMSHLRRRIMSVQTMENRTAEEKARMMHFILTESYTQHRAKSSIPQNPGIWSISRCPPHSPPSSLFQLTPEDLRPTYAPLPRPADDDEVVPDDNEQEEDVPEPALGCPHYLRNVKLQCSQCQRWYTCRFCHDESEDHALVRKETKNMLCMLCGTPQPASQSCAHCAKNAAWYYCSLCKLWDNDTSKSIYHCDDCGICRIGRGLGKDYVHCKTCGACMAIAISTSHKCIERSTDCDCPICGDYMFSSPQTVVFMRCGHSIHRDCYTAHMQTSYKCPLCSRSVVNMETQFRNLDRTIEHQPMPAHFRDTKAMVHCNDCYAKSTVAYHWLGLKCAICASYNTAQLQILKAPDALSPDVTLEASRDLDGEEAERFTAPLAEDAYRRLALEPSSQPIHPNINVPVPRWRDPMAFPTPTQIQTQQRISLSPARTPSETTTLPLERRRSGNGPGATYDGTGDGDGGGERGNEGEAWNSVESRRLGRIGEEGFDYGDDDDDDDEHDDDDEEEDEESTDDDDDEEDEDEDEGEDDGMELFGHR